MALANPSNDTSFIIDYDARVHHIFQQKGSMLMNTVRLKRGVVGITAQFPTYGVVAANKKSRHGDIVPLNPAHGIPQATMVDWYAGIYSDRLDELKTNIDEQTAAATAGARALGRRADLNVTDALQTATSIIAVGAVGLTEGKIRTATETLDGNSVDPEDRWGLVGAHQWQELESFTNFTSSDFVGAASLPFATGARTRFWKGINWMFHPNLPTSNGGANRNCYIFQKTAVGLGINADIMLDIGWVRQKQSTLIVHKLSMGAVIIDQLGVVEVLCNDTAAIS